MFLRLQSIRHKLFIAFLSISVLTVLLALLAYFQIRALDSLNNFSGKLNKLNDSFNNLLEADLELFGRDIYDTLLYIDQSSPRVNLHKSLMSSIRKQLKEHSFSNKIKHGYDSSISVLDSNLMHYDSTYHGLLKAQLMVGFKDFGLEGIMREYAHRLEDPRFNLELSDLLMLRRHEKDYLIRREPQYIRKFEIKKSAILDKLHQLKDEEAILQLEAYTQTLMQIVEQHAVIGDYNSYGLRLRLKNQAESIKQTMTSLDNTVAQEQSKIVAQTYFFFILAVFLLVIISVGLSAWLSHRFADPLERLSGLMDKMVIKRFDANDLQTELEQGDEISKLSQSFIKMVLKLRNQLTQLEHSSQQLKQQNSDLKALNNELDHFVYRAAHDLRAPLTTLLGLVDITRRDFHSGNKDINFVMMEDTIRKLDHFISDIVDYARNRRTEQTFQTIDIQALIQVAIDHYNFLPQKNKIDIQVVYEGKENLLISDKMRLNMVLSSILSNAFRFYDPEKKKPYINILVKIDAKWMELGIQDNGVGIEESHLPRIFEMFYRGSLRSKGSGLGLFIAKETVQSMGGEISLISEFGVSTTVSIKLPNQVNAKGQSRRSNKNQETPIVP